MNTLTPEHKDIQYSDSCLSLPGSNVAGGLTGLTAGIHKNNRASSWRNLLALAEPSMFHVSTITL